MRTCETCGSPNDCDKSISSSDTCKDWFPKKALDLVYAVKNAEHKRKYMIGFRLTSIGILAAWSKPSLSRGDKFDYQKGLEIITDRLNRLGEKIEHRDDAEFHIEDLYDCICRIAGTADLPPMIYKQLPVQVDRARKYFKQIKDQRVSVYIS
jgi:hypothetical protein